MNVVFLFIYIAIQWIDDFGSLCYCPLKTYGGLFSILGFPSWICTDYSQDIACKETF